MCTFRPPSINLSLRCVPTPLQDSVVQETTHCLPFTLNSLAFSKLLRFRVTSHPVLFWLSHHFFSSTILLFGTFQRAMSLQILISRPVAESAYASPILRTDLIVLRNAMRLRLRTVESDPSARSHGSKHTLWDSPMPDWLSISLEDGNGKVAILPPEEEVMLAGIYNAASHCKNGVKMVAVFGNRLVLYSVAPDAFKLCHREQQNDCVLQPLTDDEIAHVERLRWWAGNGMEDTRGRPMAVSTVFFEGTFYGCRHIVERIARGGLVFDRCELDTDNDVIMTDAEDEDDRFVSASIAAPRPFVAKSVTDST